MNGIDLNARFDQLVNRFPRLRKIVAEESARPATPDEIRRRRLADLFTNDDGTRALLAEIDLRIRAAEREMATNFRDHAVLLRRLGSKTELEELRRLIESLFVPARPSETVSVRTSPEENGDGNRPDQAGP